MSASKRHSIYKRSEAHSTRKFVETVETIKVMTKSVFDHHNKNLENSGIQLAFAFLINLLFWNCFVSVDAANPLNGEKNAFLKLKMLADYIFEHENGKTFEAISKQFFGPECIHLIKNAKEAMDVILSFPDKKSRFNILVLPTVNSPVVDAQGYWWLALSKLHEVCEARAKLKQKYELAFPKKNKKRKKFSEPTQLEMMTAEMMNF